jgi:hypothetical protein
MSLFQRKARFIQSSCGDILYPFDVKSGCDFRHHAVPWGMAFHLGRHNIGKYFSTVDHHRHRTFVAACFDPEYIHAEYYNKKPQGREPAVWNEERTTLRQEIS